MECRRVGVQIIKAVLHQIFVPFVLGVSVTKITGCFPGPYLELVRAALLRDCVVKWRIEVCHSIDFEGASNESIQRRRCCRLDCLVMVRHVAALVRLALVLLWKVGPRKLGFVNDAIEERGTVLFGIEVLLATEVKSVSVVFGTLASAL